MIPEAFSNLNDSMIEVTFARVGLMLSLEVVNLESPSRGPLLSPLSSETEEVYK